MRKIGLAKQNEEKIEQSSVVGASTAAASAASPKNQLESPRVQKGFNIRKEAQKIDLKQFDPNNVAHITPVMTVLRPPQGFRDPNKPFTEADVDVASNGGKKGAKGDHKKEKSAYQLQEEEKENNKTAGRINRAWRRLRPDAQSPGSDYSGEQDQQDAG